MKSRKNKRTNNKNKYSNKKHKKGGFIRYLFKPRMNKNEYCDEYKLKQINTPDKLQKNYSTCCPKSIFGKENTSKYCNSVRSKMYILSKNNNCSDEDSALNSYNTNKKYPDELYSKYAKCCPKNNDSEYCTDFKKYLKTQCKIDNLKNLTNTESLYGSYQACCPKGFFGTKNNSSFCKENDSLFKNAIKNEQPKEYIDDFESDINGSESDTQYGLNTLNNTIYNTIPEEDIESHDNYNYKENNSSPKLGGKNITKKRRIHYLRKHKKYSNKNITNTCKK